MSDEFFSIMNLVPRFWWRFYGITDDRYRALRDVNGKRYSIYCGDSEEALTAFVLANIDGWTQARYLHSPARNDDNGWNAEFFECIREGTKPLYAYHDTGRLDRWSQFLSKVNTLGDLAVDDVCLVFELELVNKNFNRRLSTKSQRFDRVSFTGAKNRWSQYDAALLLPKAKNLVLIEAKLGADTSSGVKGFDEIPQIIRNLEVAYFVTHHRDSQWTDWECQYLFLYPGDGTISAFKNYLSELDNLRGLLDDYRKRLEGEYRGSCDQEARDALASYYDDFVEWAIARTSKMSWNELDGMPGFRVSEYLRRLSRTGISSGILQELRKRFDTAGCQIGSQVPLPPDPTGGEPVPPPPLERPERGLVYKMKSGNEEKFIVVAGVGNKGCRVVPLQTSPGYLPKSYKQSTSRFPRSAEHDYDTGNSLPAVEQEYLWDPPPNEDRKPEGAGQQPKPPCRVVVTIAGGGETSRVKRADVGGDTFKVFTHHLRTDG